VNFFGHAAVASWDAPGEPAVVLGAMLPDFATMIGVCVSDDDSPDAAIARGVALHHRADGAFHPLPVVTALMRELGARLDAAGCARGPSRAVAHIGTELLLDGVLVGEPSYRAAYVAALAADPAGVRWREPHGTERFAVLLARLRAHGVPDDLRAVDAICARLARVLAGRPRLAPSADDLRAIRGALAAQQARVEVAAEAVMRAMRAALG
jgi:hypothetical protein